MLEALGAMPGASGIAVDVIDVDRDRALRERYGHKVPVLVLGGELVCHGRLDPAEVHKALAYQR
jgi:hypothetical protein